MFRADKEKSNRLELVDLPVQGFVSHEEKVDGSEWRVIFFSRTIISISIKYSFIYARK